MRIKEQETRLNFQEHDDDDNDEDKELTPWSRVLLGRLQFEVLTFLGFYYQSALRRIHNITAKAALKFGSEAWVLRKRKEQSLEAAQMKFLRHLLGITKLDKEKNQCVREKTGAQNIVKEIKLHGYTVHQ